MTRLRDTPLTELVGIEHPVVQTGMGWVAGARLVAATSNAGGLGILASATMTLEELADRGRQGQGGHRQAVRHQHPRRRRRRERPRRPADPRGRQGRVVRAGAQARPDRQAQRCRRGGHSVGRRGQARQEGGGLGRRRGDRPGRRGRRAHRPGRDDAAAAVGARRRRHSGRRGGRVLRRPRAGGGVVLRCRGRRDGDPLPAHLGFDRARRRQAALPARPRLDGTVVSTRVDGMPHRVLRTGLVEKLESGSRVRGFSAARAQCAEVQEDVAA